MNLTKQILKVSKRIAEATKTPHFFIMGIYNEVNFKTECPICEFIVSGFQTKDGDLMMTTVEPETVDEFHSQCNMCDVWVSFERIPKKFIKPFGIKNNEHKMILPDMNKVSHIKTKEDMYNNIKNEDDFIRDYCLYKLMPFNRSKK